MSRKKKKHKQPKPVYKHPFYSSLEWQKLRYMILKSHVLQHGKKCLLCGLSGVPLHVDHIKPRSKYPELQLDYRNLQVLCEACNLGKSNEDNTDWRGPRE